MALFTITDDGSGNPVFNIDPASDNPGPDFVTGDGQVAGFELVGGNADGTSGNDSIEGDGTPNTLNGLAGNDTINGFADADILNGGADNDSIDGGAGDDDIDGGTGADTILGSTGNDIISGGDTVAGSDDVLDYTGLNQPVSLAQVGRIIKGGANDIIETPGDVGAPLVNDDEADQLVGLGMMQEFPTINVIIGDPDFGGAGDLNTVNEIDANNLDNPPDNSVFNIDLSANSLQIQNFVGGSAVEFEVQNFVNVVGTAADDTIAGDDEDNIIVGRNGADELTGNGGDDEFLFVEDADFGDTINDFGVGNDVLNFDADPAGLFSSAFTGTSLKVITGSTGMSASLQTSSTANSFTLGGIFGTFTNATGPNASTAFTAALNALTGVDASTTYVAFALDTAGDFLFVANAIETAGGTMDIDAATILGTLNVSNVTASDIILS